MTNGWLKAVAIGATAGILNGLFGAGGGMVLVPLLIGKLGMESKEAFVTSVAVMLPLSIASYTVFCVNGGNVWAQSLPYLAGGIIGGVLSARLFRNISASWLHRVFSILILYGGVKAVLQF